MIEQYSPLYAGTAVESRRVGLAVTASLFFHVLFLSLTFGDEDFGLPGLKLFWQEQRIETPGLRVELASSAPSPLATLPPTPAPPSPDEARTAPREKPVVGKKKPPAKVKAPPRTQPLVNKPTPKSAIVKSVPRPAPAPAPVPVAVSRAVAVAPATAQVVRDNGPQPDWVPNEVEVTPIAAPEAVALLEPVTPIDLGSAIHDMETKEPPAAGRVLPAPASVPVSAAPPKPAEPPKLDLPEQRTNPEQVKTVKPERARDEAEAQHQAAQQEAERQATQQRELERQEAERLAQAQAQAAAREEAARQEAERLTAERRDMERRETEKQAMAQAAERQERERREAEKFAMAQEAQRQEKQQQAERQLAANTAAEQEAQRQAAARLEAERLEAARLEAARIEAARLEAARIEAEQLAVQQREAARLDAERREAMRLEAERLAVQRAAEEQREARLRAIGKQLDQEAATRDAPELPVSLSTARRIRMWGRSDANKDLEAYAATWAGKIELNTPAEIARDLAKRPHTDPMVTVAVRSDGTIESVTIVLSSGVPEVDAAIRNIVQSHAPYPPFPAGLARQADVVEIRRTWRFDVAIRLN